jgi:hypothetical protein
MMVIWVSSIVGWADGDRRTGARRRVGILSAIDGMWFRCVTDVGLPGPDRGESDRCLIVDRAITARFPTRLPHLARRHDTGDRDRAVRSWSRTTRQLRSRQSEPLSAIEASGMSINTVLANDSELTGLLAAIGIVHGQPFDMPSTMLRAIGSCGDARRDERRASADRGRYAVPGHIAVRISISPDVSEKVRLRGAGPA